MKKLLSLVFFAAFLLIATESHAQEEYGNALNVFVKFGDNSSIGAYYEFQVADDITVPPEARIWFGGDNEVALGARGDYYFDRLFNLAEPWDIWGGAGIGFLINGDDSLDFNIHAGGEYKFNETWGLILEIGGGRAFSGGLGVGIHF